MRLQVGQVENSQNGPRADAGDPAGLDENPGQKGPAEYGIAFEAQARGVGAGGRDDRVPLRSSDPARPSGARRVGQTAVAVGVEPLAPLADSGQEASGLVSLMR
jgi:hypothetical protein